MYQRKRVHIVVTKAGVIKMDRCCICGKYCMGHTNYAMPFASGLCCDDCYRIYVMPYKVGDTNMKEIKDEQRIGNK